MATSTLEMGNFLRYSNTPTHIMYSSLEGIAQGERFRLVGLLTSPQQLWVAAPPLDALGNPFFILNSPQADDFTQYAGRRGMVCTRCPRRYKTTGSSLGSEWPEGCCSSALLHLCTGASNMQTKAHG